MRKIILLTLLIASACVPTSAQKTKAAPNTRVLSAREIAEKIMPSVVLIITQDEDGNPISQGSGFVFQPGLVVSNLHVFERASSAIVKNVKTGEVAKAIEVVAMNAQQDICVIRIESSKFPVLSLGDSFAVKTGDDIYVASNPKGLEGSFTKGIVSNVRERDRASKVDNELTVSVKNISGETDRTLFQIDAAISPGSSGGVVVNSKGEAIGIVKSSLVSGQNLNFAIPIEQLTSLSRDFNHPIKLAGSCALSDREQAGLNGEVRSVWEDGLIFRYDQFGNEIARELEDYAVLFTFDINRLPKTRTEKENGKVVKEIRYDRATSIEMKLDRRISAGRKGSLKDGELWIYDRNGSVREFTLFDSKTVRDFDENGRVVREMRFRMNKVTEEIRYEYKEDQNGNWIERKKLTRQYIERRGFGPWDLDSTAKRELKYYD